MRYVYISLLLFASIGQAFSQVSWGYNYLGNCGLSENKVVSTANQCYATTSDILPATVSGWVEFQNNYIRPIVFSHTFKVGFVTTTIDPSVREVNNVILPGVEEQMAFANTQGVKCYSHRDLLPGEVEHFPGSYYRIEINRDVVGEALISYYTKPSVDSPWELISSSRNDGLYNQDLKMFFWSQYAGPVLHNFEISFSNAALLADGTSAWLTETANEANSYTNGKVAIGYDQSLTGGGYGLYVADGGTRATRVKVDQSSGVWPDYVFEDSYNLPSLAEVDEFIRVNKHLPNVPSEAEVKEEGINVEGMVRVLLEKIEELTLYTIEQQKEIERLKVERGMK